MTTETTNHIDDVYSVSEHQGWLS